MLKCTICKEQITTPKDSIGTGYGTDAHNHKICYNCIGALDYRKLLKMKPGDKTTLYHTREPAEKNGCYNWYVSNWPGTFKHHCVGHVGNHNIAGTRYDLWFALRDRKTGYTIRDPKTGTPKHCFHGVRYGDITEICHIRKIKPENY